MHFNHINSVTPLHIQRTLMNEPDLGLDSLQTDLWFCAIKSCGIERPEKDSGWGILGSPVPNNFSHFFHDQPYSHFFQCYKLPVKLNVVEINVCLLQCMHVA